MSSPEGTGYGYVSDRVAVMEHHKLLAKPEKEWELGTFPHPNFAAITAVVDYVCWLGGHFTDATDRRTLFVTGMDRRADLPRSARRRKSRKPAHIRRKQARAPTSCGR